MRLGPWVVGLVSFLSMNTLAPAQQPVSQMEPQGPSLTVTSRAVVVDVIVTDSSGKPVTGLGKDAFSVTEQGKQQTISFFEENGAGPPPAQPVMQMPKLPPDVFTNFSPFPQPPAVNVLVLDTLNTPMADEMNVHKQALNFLESAKPGRRTAIFTMGLVLHFIQGFNDDPAVLAAALNNKKNIEVEPAVMLKSQAESNAQQKVAAMGAAGLGHLFGEMDQAMEDDRKLITLGNLQRLAIFLEAFPGRKNIIWFSERPPGVFNPGGSTGNPAIDDEIKKTLAMLGTARAALYPVDARGTAVNAQYTAENNPAVISVDGGANRAEDMERNTDQINAQILAEQSGGRAFANRNGLSDIIDQVTSNSSHFYTLSYVPTNTKMDGVFRKIGVKVAGGNYSLSYRRGYFAVDTRLTSTMTTLRKDKGQKENPGEVDPLLPFMDLGMPQSEQILYKVRILPAVGEKETAEKKDKSHYKIDFAIDLNDLKLDLGADGVHRGALNISLIVYDRYGNVISREDHVAGLNIKPDAYAMFQNTGVQLHAEVAVPKGNYWLRTGVYDQGSRKVGTMEVALASVVPLDVSAAAEKTMESASAKTAAVAPVPVMPFPAATVAPVSAGEKITVAQLEDKLAGARGKRDKDLAKELGGMQLNERLNSQKLAKMQAELPGEKSRQALLVLADASVFLQLPAAEIVATAPPDAEAQKLILSKAAENLAASVHKLPDFFARQTTHRFHDLKVSYLSAASAPVILEHQAFQPLDNFSDTVSYRNGQEVEESGEKQPKVKAESRNGLVNWGVFGPLQRIVVTDIYQGKMQWSHWEERATGPVAVFQYSIPKEKSNYIVKYCCFGTPNTGLRSFESIPPFHGEIAIDPASGAVHRLVLITELSPSDPVFQAEIMVEYDPMEIGGKTYICPSRSVTISTATASILRQGCWGADGVTGDCGPMVAFKPRDTAINDTVYDAYHVFGSEMRIVPEGNE